MPSFPSFASVDLKFPSVDLTTFDLSNLDLPKFDLPKFDLPKFDLPTVDLPTIDVDRVRTVARDVAYVGIGLTVLAVQRAQVARRDLTEAAERAARAVRRAA